MHFIARLPIVRRVFFFYYYKKSDFARAIACLAKGVWPNNGDEQSACYRLGLYQTVANSKWDGKHLQGGIAIAISHALCGDFDSARMVINHLIMNPNFNRHKIRLATGIAGTMPEDALALLKHSDDNESCILKAALLLRLNNYQEASTCLSKSSVDSNKPIADSYLLLSNQLTQAEPLDKLKLINKFLTSHGLSEVALKNVAHVPRVGNLLSSSTLPKVDGPLVSVLMTAYNAAAYIDAALDGLLSQTYHNIEIIVINDCSTDNTEDMILNYAQKDARVKYVKMPENAGTYAAKSVGFQHAQGDFVTCHDSDDWSHPMRLEKQVKPLIDDKDLVATASQWVRVQNDGIFYARAVYPLTRLNPASPLFRRKAVMEQTGLWDTVRTGADSEFYARLKLVFGRKSVRLIKLPLTFGAHRDDSLMTSAATGYTEQGISLERLLYWEAWTHWHIEQLSQGKSPVMSNLQEIKTGVRKFEAPKDIVISPKVLKKCF